MAKIELELSEDTLHDARRSAEASHVALEQWLTEAVRRAARDLPSEDALLGLFADAPELMDAATEEALRAREQHPLRQAYG